MVLQTAIPKLPSESTEETKDEEPKERRPFVPPIFANGIPNGMLPNNNPQKKKFGTPTESPDSEEEEIESTIKNINYNMLFILASGIGLGVLLCYKGFNFVTPAMKAAAAVVEETTSIVDE